MLDTYALLAYLKKEDEYEKVATILSSDTAHPLMNDINIGETFYILVRERGQEDAEYFLNVILPTLPITNIGNTLLDVIEADIYNTSEDPAEDKIRFWLTECRTPELLVSLAAKYPEIASAMTINRPLLRSAIEGNYEEIRKLLRDEEDREREIDRQYWAPLKAELEVWRSKRRKNEK
ncbi:MAG: hypothetical protein SCARUB_00089 [Candidatus Scalindua rubra]|uniref:PIN domain-containing protein n=1 Tax=Candidatus Scalindua rubra TaxID=1872076 RepID=A0A1E3XGV6_9BACT|nr:MAG: hypothetical protein SCARUB_00089 [Candidatus Scalindua rubra]